MRFKGFVGPSYQTPAVQVDAERSINLYPEFIAGDGGSPEESVLIRTPGLSWMSAFNLGAAGAGRGLFAVGGRCFAVVADRFYELTATLSGSLIVYAATLRGTLNGMGTTGPVRMASNGVQVMILSSLTASIFDLTTNTLTDLGFMGFNWNSTGLATVDTYFIAVNANSNQFQISAPLNGLSWSPIDFGSTQEADAIVALEELHGYLWIFGSNTIVVFQDTGSASFPFQRVPGSKVEMGLGAAFSILKLDNSIFWLGTSSRGPAMVFRADGFLPSRVSTHALEAAMQGYSTTADAVASTYEERGHLFYRLDFPSAGATWVYDVATKAWHERAWWNTGTGAYTIHPARFHAFCFNKHLVLDYATGKVYEQSLTYYDDAGNPLRWLRRAPHITDNDGRRKLFYGRFELIMNVGWDLPPGSNPLIFLRWSNDGGVTWSSDHGAAASAGTTGQYARRVLWRQLGGSRSRVFEVSGSDPLPDLVLIGAELRLTRGIS
jgi:hypothetical protein